MYVAPVTVSFWTPLLRTPAAFELVQRLGAFHCKGEVVEANPERIESILRRGLRRCAQYSEQGPVGVEQNGAVPFAD